MDKQKERNAEMEGKKKNGREKDCTIWRVIAAWWNVCACANSRTRDLRTCILSYRRLRRITSNRVKYPRWLACAFHFDFHAFVQLDQQNITRNIKRNLLLLVIGLYKYDFSNF